MKKLLFIIVAMAACVTAWAAEGYAIYTSSNATLTFYYGTRPSGAYALNSDLERPAWDSDGTHNQVARVVFDPSFAQARPTSTSYWFSEMQNLSTITGLNYLRTDQVTTMRFMFGNCKKLNSIDLSHFNTSRVTDFIGMFYGCSGLKLLDVSHLSTSQATDMSSMFSACSGLQSLDLSRFNTSKVTNMKMMFYECSSLTNLSLRSFNTSNVTSMYHMFYLCENLRTLDLSSFNTAKVTDMRSMFEFCEHLAVVFVGGKWSTAAVTTEKSEYMFGDCYNIMGNMGTTYDENHIDKAYAHIDGGSSDPGYFSWIRYVFGDLNGDGNVNVTDVTTLVNMILGIIPADQFLADVNGDGKVNVSDVTSLINVILHIG
jgi:surface protein